MLEYEMELQRELEEWERRQAAKQSRMMEYNEESESNTLMMDDDYDDTCYYNEDYDPFDPWNNIDTSIAVLFDESMDDYGGDADLFFDAHDDYFD
jgi:phosphoribulokinase